MSDRTVRVRLEALVSGFQANIAKAQQSTIRFGQAATKSLDKNRQQWDTLSRTAGLAGLAIGAGVGLAVKTFADFDQAMSRVASTGEDARNNLDALRKVAVTAGKDIGFSAEQSADGIEALLKAGVTAQDVIGGGLKGALDLAAAGELAVGDAAETAATAMTQFGLSGREVPHIADLLAAGAGKAQGDVSDLALALKQGGLVASQFGLSLEDTVGSLAAFASEGLIGSDAGTSFKTMLLALANPSKKAAKTMADLGISAYDAQGNFVGITDLAEQLHDKMRNLTPAVRDQAMAQIFGNDAVRAANVLYKQGGQGIQDWINQTNDAGYAAQVAATKQDNLAGDLRKLKSTLDSVFIESGGGANKALRDLVQGVTDLVDKIGNLPTPVLEGGLAIAAVAAGSLLAFAGVSKFATGVAETRRALDLLAPSGSRARGALTGVGKAGLIAAAGLAATAAAGAAMNSSIQKNSVGVTGYTSALLDLAKGGDGLDESFRQLGKSWLIFGSDVKDTTTTFKSLKEAQDTWITQGATFVGNVIGMKSSLQLLRDQFDQVDKALAGLPADQAGAAFAKLAKDATTAGLSMEDQLKLFDDYKTKLQQQANELGVTTLSAQDYYDWMGGKVPAAVQAAMKNNPAYKKSVEEVGESNKEAAKSVDELTEALFKQAHAALDASGAAIGYEKSIDDTTDSLKKNGRTLDIHTEKGRANRQALDQQAQAAIDLISAQAKNDASTGKLVKTTENARKQFIKNATQMGLTKKAAEKLADSYGLVPKDVKTTFTTPGAKEAKQKAEDLKKKLDGLPKDVKTTITTLLDQGKYAQAKAAYDSFKNKNVYITFHNRGSTPGGNLGGPQMSAYATGGPITGPGTGTSDSILMLGSNGEHMWTAREVQAFGGHDKMIKFRKDILDGVARFATGGPVVDRTVMPGYRYQTNVSPIVEQARTPVQVTQYISSPDPYVGATAASQRMKAFL